MNLTARIKGNTLEIFDATTGGIQRSHSLPPGEYNGPTISGDICSVTIMSKYGGDKIRTINLKTGALVSEISM